MAKVRVSKDDLLSLSEVARRAGISMPTALRYKNDHAARIPSVGKGRTQRFRPEAVAVFVALRGESRRGRRAKSGATRAAQARPSAGAAPSSYLSLSEVGRRTRISYPTLLRYVKHHLPQLPHRGSGRTRRFAPESVEVFARLRSESRRGRRPAGAAAGAPAVSNDLLRRLDRIEQLQRGLASQLRALEKAANRPLRVIVGR